MQNAILFAATGKKWLSTPKNNQKILKKIYNNYKYASSALILKQWFIIHKSGIKTSKDLCGTAWQ